MIRVPLYRTWGGRTTYLYVFCKYGVVEMDVQTTKERAMTLRQCLRGGTSSDAIIWCWRQRPQYLLVRSLRVDELLAEWGGMLTHGVWQEYDGLLCLASSFADALAAARGWADPWHTVVMVH